MGMLVPSDLTGVDELLALRLIGVAISIAPCLDNLPEGRNRQIAVALIRGIAVEAKTRGSRLVRAQRIDTASVDYTSAESWFSGDDRVALRALCGAGEVAGSPVGSFPRAGMVSQFWPEGPYTS